MTTETLINEPSTFAAPTSAPDYRRMFRELEQLKEKSASLVVKIELSKATLAVLTSNVDIVQMKQIPLSAVAVYENNDVPAGEIWPFNFRGEKLHVITIPMPPSSVSVE